jgi:hypothetical protein
LKFIIINNNFRLEYCGSLIIDDHKLAGSEILTEILLHLFENLLGHAAWPLAAATLPTALSDSSTISSILGVRYALGVAIAFTAEQSSSTPRRPLMRVGAHADEQARAPRLLVLHLVADAEAQSCAAPP